VQVSKSLVIIGGVPSKMPDSLRSRWGLGSMYWKRMISIAACSSLQIDNIYLFRYVNISIPHFHERTQYRNCSFSPLLQPRDRHWRMTQPQDARELQSDRIPALLLQVFVKTMAYQGSCNMTSATHTTHSESKFEIRSFKPRQRSFVDVACKPVRHRHLGSTSCSSPHLR